MMTENNTKAEAVPPPQEWRRALPRWIQLLVLLVVFIAGGVAGSMVTTKVIHTRMEGYRQQAPIFSEDIVMRLRMRLGLTDEQADQVQEIIERHHSKLVAYRNDGSQMMHTEFDAMVDEVETVLTDPQVQRWRGIASHVRRTYLPAQADRS